ncbi:MAG: leucyl aminopeptidase [Cytophagaceae bacterium]|jgi:leucyl aminopeptidase|nr:leucyl aminopeptidase [Cytophagaceae bacterium]
MKIPDFFRDHRRLACHVVVFDELPSTPHILELEFALHREETFIHIRDRNQDIVYVSVQKSDAEGCRRRGAELAQFLISKKLRSCSVESTAQELASYYFAEGLLLRLYDFDFYKTDATKVVLPETLAFHEQMISESSVIELKALVKAVHWARDLVNQPVSFLTAEKLSQEFLKKAEETGFDCTVLTKEEITSLRMGGLLAVNQGAPNPPTFSILEYRPTHTVQAKPFVLVGKGVVYDTGGLSLKPTEGSMDFMKCDMAGAAVVAACIYLAAQLQLPYHLIGLIPATENRPSGNAFAPGDIITMHDGTTVEVLNTDAEGRLILADALAYAKRYDPGLVIDLATLTGSAARAVGKNAAVMMGTAEESLKKAMVKAGMDTFERLVEFPLWEDYKESIKSDIADLNNLGGPEAGAITAGKFLEHFTQYPWMHLDIAGTAFFKSTEAYRVKGGTGFGVRLLYQFLKNLS